VKIKINPSMVCADLSKLGQQVEVLNDAGVDLFHWDIMDGVYVHNFCLTPNVMAACRPFSDLPFDVHLCISDPASFIPEVAEAGAGIISLQLETTPHLHRAVEQIHRKGINAGVVINPSTPLSCLESILSEVQMITVMTVDVGFAGQNFIYPMLGKITALRKIIDEKGLEIDIQVDGQINAKTISQIIKAGANVLVLGTSGLFSLSDDIGNAVQVVRNQIHLAVSEVLI
jgi:ribulose-phosphate 3-epimerase